MLKLSAGVQRVVAALLLGPGLLVSSRAAAIEVNGETLPVIPDEHTECESDVWYCVNEHEDALGYDGEDIDVVETATIDQETFNPLCNLTFEVLFKGASYINVFGWYEARRDGDGNPIKPEPEDMHVMLGCDTPVGEVVDLPSPDGVTEIGFFLANNRDDSCVTDEDGILDETQENLFFSQPELNEDDGRVHLLIWQSRANPTAFYFGWEDLFNGGDNDFEDLLTFVTGIQCAGGGDLCETGEQGICARGIEQCRDGALTCVPLQEPREERCNALDDDCDGNVDDGDELCDDREVCYRGKCQPRCGGGEFQCDLPLVCGDAGVCVDEACLDVACETGEVCRAGECVGACDDVICPYGMACRAGVCVDVCEGVECDAGFSCQVSTPEELDGEAVGLCSSCGCTGCADGFSCEDNLCVEDACVDRTCNVGFRCEAGECVDNCAGSSCPVATRCEAGACVPDEDYVAPGEGGGAGAMSMSSTTGISLGGRPATGSGASGGNAGSNGTQGLSEPNPIVQPAGCGCRFRDGGRMIPGWPLMAIAMLLGGLTRRTHTRRREGV